MIFDVLWLQYIKPILSERRASFFQRVNHRAKTDATRQDQTPIIVTAISTANSTGIVVMITGEGKDRTSEK